MTEEILREFGTQTPPPSSLDVDSVLRAGRTRMRTRRWGVAGAAAVAVAVAVGGTSLALRPEGGTPQQFASPGTPSTGPSPSQRAAPDLTCTVAALPGSKNVMAGGIDPTGRYVVAVLESGRLVMWDNGAPLTLPVPPGAEPQVGGVNSAGVVVGTFTRNGRRDAFVYQGSYRILARPAGAKDVHAWDINDRGEIAGEAAYPDNGTDVGPSKALRWKVSDPSKVEVLPSTTKWASPLDIGADGTIAGSLDDGGAPHLWRPDGSVATPPGLNGATNGKVFALAGDWAFGWSGVVSDKTGEVLWVRWNLKTGSVVQLENFWPAAVGVDGTVAGQAGTIGSGSAAIWRDGTATLLPKLDGQNGAEIHGASEDLKTIVGTVGHSVAIWRC